MRGAADTAEIIAKYRESHGAGGNGSHLDVLSGVFAGIPADGRLPLAVDAFRASQAAAVAGATVNRRLACLRAALNWAVRRGLLVHNPVSVWELVEEKARTRILTPEEESRLLAGLRDGPRSGYLYPAVRFALRNPVRARDLFSLNTSDVDLQRSYVSFEAQKTGNRTYLVVWDAETRTYMEHAKGRLGPLFPNHDGARVNVYKGAFAAGCRRAGIDGFRFHDLRRCAATWMLEHGGFRPADLEKLGLWRSWATVQKYYHQVEVADIQRRVSGIGRIAA